MVEQTLVLFKPDCVQRAICGEVISRFEKMGLKIVALKLVWVDIDFAGKHYTYEDIAVRHGEEVRNNLIKFLISGPVMAIVLEGVEVIEVARKICGSTEPKKSPPGTIRGDFSHHSYSYCNDKKIAIQNIIHASANKEDADREIPLWFNKNEIIKYNRIDDVYHYG